jgi:hypothetical protein
MKTKELIEQAVVKHPVLFITYHPFPVIKNTHYLSSAYGVVYGRKGAWRND